MFKYGKKKPQGATRNQPKAAPLVKPSAVPSVLLVALGMAIGLCLAFLLYLWKPWQPAKKPQAQTTEQVAKPAATVNTSHLEFYTLLSSQRVNNNQATDSAATVPATSAASTVAKPATPKITEPKKEEPKKVEPKPNKPIEAKDLKSDVKSEKKAEAKEKAKDKPEKATVKADPKAVEKDKKADAAKAKEKEKEPVKKEVTTEKPKATDKADNVKYSLQAGSFKSQAEAERRRAKVAMAGLPVRVQQVRIKEGEMWYRVVVGPFTGKDRSQSAQSNLRGEGVDSLMIKQEAKKD